jgi:putative endonuclease
LVTHIRPDIATVGSVNTTATHNQLLGHRGERIAEQWLARKGWRVLQRRFRDGHRDIDLIAERNGTVAFVEVKARSGDLFGGPVAAVGWRKQREVARSARVWISRHGRPGEAYRFDVIGVLLTPRGPAIHHVENAFGAPM